MNMITGDRLKSLVKNKLLLFGKQAFFLVPKYLKSACELFLE